MLPRRLFLQGAATAGLQGAATAADLIPMTIMLDWLLNPNHAGLFAAQRIGAFGRAGLAVRIVSPSDPDLPCRLVAAGQVDLAVSYGSQINMITSAGLPLLRVATLVDRPLNTVTALGGVKTLADLRGKTVGYSVAGVEEAVLDVMLGSAGLKANDVTTVKVNYDMVAALLSRRLDAAIGAYRNAEVIQLRQMGQTPVVFLPEEHGVPLYDELILVAQRERAADDRLKRFVGALQEGVAAVRSDPGGMWRAFAQAHSELDAEYVEIAWNMTVPLLARDPGRLDENRYEAFQQFCLAQRIIAKPQPLSQYAAQIMA